MRALSIEAVGLVALGGKDSTLRGKLDSEVDFETALIESSPVIPLVRR